MLKTPLAIGVGLGLLLIQSASAQTAISSDTGILHAKQLAGPATEFAELAPAKTIDAAIYSKSALIPVVLSEEKGGAATWQSTFPIEESNARLVLLGGENSDWQLELGAPGTPIQRAANLVSEQRRTDLGLGNERFDGELFTLQDVAEGDWQFRIRSNSGLQKQGFLLLEGDSDTQLVSYLADRNLRVGETIEVKSSISERSEEQVLLRSEGISEARALLRAPDGNSSEHALALDASGQYSFSFSPQVAGDYTVQIMVRGTTLAHDAYVRTAEHALSVVADSIDLADSQSRLEVDASGRLNFSIPVDGQFESHYRAFAQVWGKNAAGHDVAVAWVGGMVPVQQNRSGSRIDLALDARWVAMAGAQAPFSLRELRIEEPNHFVTLASAKNLPVSSADIDFAKQLESKPSDIVIDDSMRTGPRPAEEASRGVGQRLLLVHGYCSGNVWPSSQFSNASVFSDNNKNRSHDQFARLIQSFGATWNSFGVVAHSQGGAASLHLYNYYWSGLDNAGAGRLIQSVGTPYQGTNLAGLLAAIGGIFGVGCGTNTDLTYSGASAWLAGISSSSRAKVNYYTTSFRNTNWWTNDYCQFAADLVLSDPEDGTTEQAKGQLSSAVNRGHVTGQCHTTNMRDPAQYLDSSRNATMSTNAAR